MEYRSGVLRAGQGPAIAVHKVSVQPPRPVALGVVQARLGVLRQDLRDLAVVPPVADRCLALFVAIEVLGCQY
jgi:hypothetical protein